MFLVVHVKRPGFQIVLEAQFLFLMKLNRMTYLVQVCPTSAVCTMRPFPLVYYLAPMGVKMAICLLMPMAGLPVFGTVCLAVTFSLGCLVVGNLET